MSVANTLTLYNPVGNVKLNVEFELEVIISVKFNTWFTYQSTVKLDNSGSSAVMVKFTVSPSKIFTGVAGEVNVILGAPNTGGNGLTVTAHV